MFESNHQTVETGRRQLSAENEIVGRRQKIFFLYCRSPQKKKKKKREAGASVYVVYVVIKPSPPDGPDGVVPV